MRRLIRLLPFAFCLLLGLDAEVQAQPQEPRVIMISIDGLMPSAYTDATLEAQTPNLRRLAKSGCGRTA
jgi:predicted AlkP superfamily pyrophosphatase or phosphodiesterase